MAQIVANENKLSFTDVVEALRNDMKENHGIELSKSKAKDVFIEAVIRNVVYNEIETMMLFICDEEKYHELMDY